MDDAHDADADDDDNDDADADADADDADDKASRPQIPVAGAQQYHSSFWDVGTLQVDPMVHSITALTFFQLALLHAFPLCILGHTTRLTNLHPDRLTGRWVSTPQEALPLPLR